MNRTRVGILLVLALVLGWQILSDKDDSESTVTTLDEMEHATAPMIPNEMKNEPTNKAEIASKTIDNSEDNPSPKTQGESTTSLKAPTIKSISSNDRPKSPRGLHVLPYTMDEGLIVVQGDLVVGKPADSNFEETGWVEMPKLRPWPSSRIPYLIAADFPEPERVQAALQMFENTSIQWVPHSGEKDAVVFQASEGVCKSYVGHVGGLQPIWISRSCGASEVAHEMMHALGFVHEQNRTDRDQFLRIAFENMDPSFKINFEILPRDFMLLTGLSEFDFESLMIYSENLFSINGSATMYPRSENQRISPSRELSAKDRERLVKFYGARSRGD